MHTADATTTIAVSRRLLRVALASALILSACGSDDSAADERGAETTMSRDDQRSDDEAGDDQAAGDDDEAGDDEAPGDDEAGSGDDPGDDEAGDDQAAGDDDEAGDDEAGDDDEAGGDDEAGSGDDPADDGGSTGAGLGPSIDLSLERDDVDCDADDLDPTGTTPFTDVHYVVDGVLGAVCLGDGDETLTEAWNVLATITPRLQLADLALFGAFGADEDGAADEITLAFVNALDADGTQFQMSVNLESYRDDPDEALLTMAHEFSHVFTAVPSQIDRTEESANNCFTYDNGEGCFEPDSLMAEWVELFWGGGLIDGVDPNVEATGAGGQERCDANPGFLGAYAASNPEEDFAESFSAFVFDLDVDTPEVQAKLDWMGQQPGLVEFRDRAAAADFGELQNNFEPCG